MRIRRRPQAQALVPSPLHHPSYPCTAPPPPANQHHWLSREKRDAEEEEEEEEKLGELHRPNVDLGDDPSQPQGNNVVGGRSGSKSNPGPGGAQRQAGAAAGHGRIEHGNHDDYEGPVINAAGQGLANGSALASPAPPMLAKEGIKSDGHKRRRGMAVLLEGSRCSRVNGRGWRCSQPTLVGYSLCEHHLGKGRQSRSASANGGSASSRKSAVAMALVTVAAAPDAN